MASSELINAVKLIEEYYKTDTVNGIYDIIAAFRNALMKDEDIYVLTETLNRNGKKYSVFLLLDDGQGHSLFPLLTGVDEMMAVKNRFESSREINTGIMKLKYVIKLISEKNICDGVIVNPAGRSFTAPVSFYTDILKEIL